MVRRDLTSHPSFAALAAPHCFQRLRGRKMGHVQARSGELLGQLHVTLDHGRFRGCLHAAQPQTERGWAVVHRAVFGHARVLGVLNHGKIESGSRRSVSRMMVSLRMGRPSSLTRDRTGALQGSEVGKHGALAGVGGGSDRKDVDHRASLRLLDPGDPFGRVDDGGGVRHAAHGSESASRRRRGSGCDAFLVALAWLAQVDVQIDEAGRDDQAAGIEYFVCAAADLVRRRDLGDSAVTQQHVHECVQLRGGIDDATAFDQQGSRFLICRLPFCAFVANVP